MIMDSGSLAFVGFGLLFALISNLNRSPTWRSAVLLLASLTFLTLLAPHWTTLMPLFGFLSLGYAGVLLIRRGWTSGSVWSILVCVLAYVWLKKYTFLPAATFLQRPYVLLGLSYIFFRVLHLLIEAGENDEIRSMGPIAYLLYTINFTTFVSGPIQRYDAFTEDQFASPPIPLGVRTIGTQLERLVRGFFKVNVLAMLLHALDEDAMTQLFHPLPLWPRMFAAMRVAVIYPLFLYANFSGYIDMVIALARLMRLRLPENFNRPFTATSAIEFWSRWHMTLSNWLKTYVYNPLLLALMRRITSRAVEPFLGVFCFFVTFFLVGVWHGRTSEFVFFGVMQGGGVSINKLWQVALTRTMGRKEYNKLAKHPVYDAFGRGLTFAWFASSLFWFWLNWSQIDRILHSLTTAQWICVWTAIWLCATAALALWEWARAALLSIEGSDGPILTSRYAYMVYASALGLAAFVISVLLNQPAPDIVYKAF